MAAPAAAQGSCTTVSVTSAAVVLDLVDVLKQMLEVSHRRLVLLWLRLLQAEVDNFLTQSLPLEAEQTPTGD
jgi:hypothetical protein